MNIFYPEYAFLLIVVVIAAWHILKDVADGDGRKKRRRLARDGMSDNEKKSDKQGKERASS